MIKIIFAKIPYTNEIILICNNIHISLGHESFFKCKKQLLESEYYWEGCTPILESVSKNYHICAKTKSKVTIKKKPKQTIIKGPHIKYLIDLWELENNLSEMADYEYIVTIVDHFSKLLLRYYPIIN